MIGLSQQGLQKIEAGQRKIGDDRIKRLIKIFNCTYDELLSPNTDIDIREHSKNARRTFPKEESRIKKFPYNPIYRSDIAAEAMEEVNKFMETHRLGTYLNDATTVLWRVYRLLEKGEKVTDVLLEMFFEDIDTFDYS